MLRANVTRWMASVGVLMVALLASACGSADKAPAEAAIKTFRVEERDGWVRLHV